MARKYRDKSLHDNILAKKNAVILSQRRFFLLISLRKWSNLP